MCAAFRKAKTSDWFCGVHECCCGARSTACDYRLTNGYLTNSLCVHYLAHHRSEVPPHELRRIESFTFAEVDPTDQELQGPEIILERVRARVGTERLCTWNAWGLDVESLVQGLTGGVMDSDQGVAQNRLGAEILLDILHTITIDGLSVVKEVVKRDDCDVGTGGASRLWMEAGSMGDSARGDH